MKPFKGTISNWTKIPCDRSLWPGEKEPNLGYVITGVPHGHPEFVSWIRTSPVVKESSLGTAIRIETLNSLYYLEEKDELTDNLTAMGGTRPKAIL